MRRAAMDDDPELDCKGKEPHKDSHNDDLDESEELNLPPTTTTPKPYREPPEPAPTPPSRTPSLICFHVAAPLHLHHVAEQRPSSPSPSGSPEDPDYFDYFDDVDYTEVKR